MPSKEKIEDEKGVSICRYCVQRFRRIFIPRNTEGFVDDNGESIFEGDDGDVVVYNLCLLSGIELDLTCTIDCSHFEEKEEDKDHDLVKLFKKNLSIEE